MSTINKRVLLLVIGIHLNVFLVLFAIFILPKFYQKEFPHWNAFKSTVHAVVENAKRPSSPIDTPLQNLIPQESIPHILSNVIRELVPIKASQESRSGYPGVSIPKRSESEKKTDRREKIKELMAQFSKSKTTASKETKPEVPRLSFYTTDYHGNHLIQGTDFDIAFDNLEEEQAVDVSVEQIDAQIQQFKKSIPDEYILHVGPFKDKTLLTNAKNNLWNQQLRTFASSDQRYLISAESYSMKSLTPMKTILAQAGYPFRIVKNQP